MCRWKVCKAVMTWQWKCCVTVETIDKSIVESRPRYVDTPSYRHPCLNHEINVVHLSLKFSLVDFQCTEQFCPLSRNYERIKLHRDHAVYPVLSERHHCSAVHSDRHEASEMEQTVVLFEALNVLKTKWDFFCLLFEHHDRHLGLLRYVLAPHTNPDPLYPSHLVWTC